MDLVSNTVYVLNSSAVVYIGNYLQLIIGNFVLKIILNYGRLFKLILLIEIILMMINPIPLYSKCG